MSVFSKNILIPKRLWYPPKYQSNNLVNFRARDLKFSPKILEKILEKKNSRKFLEKNSRNLLENWKQRKNAKMQKIAKNTKKRKKRKNTKNVNSRGEKI